MNFYIADRDDSTDTYIENLTKAGEAGEIEVDEIEVWDDGVLSLADWLLGRPAGYTTDDQLIPSHAAPHLLARLFVEIFDRKGWGWQMIPFPEEIGTPYEIDLQEGLKAISFTTEQCVDNCIEPEVCPLTKGDLDWDVGGWLEGYIEGKGNVSLFRFECTHFAREVATIPMQQVLNAWQNMEAMLTEEKERVFLIATHSKCHGITALIEVVPPE